ncbi:MAG: hypothetical protein R2750_11355 [Bacteroidales bacterium]
MKKIVKGLSIYLFVFILLFATQVFGDNPPDPGGDPTGGTPVGGGSPIGGGLFILLSLGMMYAGRKIISIRKKILE